MARWLPPLLLAAGLAFVGSAPAVPQGRPVAAADGAAMPAALVANQVRIDGAGRLVASGAVEVFYKGSTLRATEITFDRAKDQLQITGPMVLVDGENTILIASMAELSADLTEGILTSARLVLNRQLQMAASSVERTAGRYTQLENVVASSCKVCAGNPTPLWEIRAQRVTHDQVEQQIFFDSATFRLAGVPVMYFPRLRMPDPTLKRATGVLMPQIRTTSGLGTGIKLPYFITLGPHRDLTLTPYLSSKSGRSLEMRYRQAFATGEVQIDGAVSRDLLLPGVNRHYLKVTGAFDLPRDFKLTFRGEDVSDPAYLLDYGLPAKDRLDSRIEVSRTRRNEYISGRLIGFKSIRSGDVNAFLPSVISDLTFHRRFSGGILGGEAGLKFQTHGHYRSSQSPLDSDGDGFADGRDVRRVSLKLDWRRNVTLPMGIVGSALGEVVADVYDVTQDATFAGSTTRISGAAAVELRWPWMRSGADGHSDLIEPVFQAVWAPTRADTLKNEDSILVEFDESNLFSLNRFPGSDARERGPRLNLGIGYTHMNPDGWTVSAAVGRVFRTLDPAQFSVASGLDGKRSDLLAAVQLTNADGFSLTHRMILASKAKVTKAETRLAYSGETYGLSGSYVWALADASENRPKNTSELAVNGRYVMNESWTAFTEARYDFQANRANKAGMGLRFKNECISMDVSVSRRFTSSTSVKPTTDFGLTIDLIGFGGSALAGPSRTCRR